MRAHQPALLVLTSEESHPDLDADLPFERERQRVAALVTQAGGDADPFVARLAVAADQFLICRTTVRKKVPLPWRKAIRCAPWSPVTTGSSTGAGDTMISLEGLMLATGRHAKRAPRC